MGRPFVRAISSASLWIQLFSTCLTAARFLDRFENALWGSWRSLGSDHVGAYIAFRFRETLFIWIKVRMSRETRWMESILEVTKIPIHDDDHVAVGGDESISLPLGLVHTMDCSPRHTNTQQQQQKPKQEQSGFGWGWCNFEQGQRNNVKNERCFGTFSLLCETRP